MEAVGVMAGGIAHNFNNNLAIILGNLELLRRKLPAENNVSRYLDNAYSAILRSRDLVLQILTYGRKGIYTKVQVLLSLVVDETLQLLHSTIPSTVIIQQTISANSSSSTINADSTQSQDALINLCNNAVYAINEKGALHILLDAVELKQEDIPAQYERSPGIYARLSVQDNGCGMTGEILEKVFDPFFTTKEVNEGAGMGLSTVQEIAQVVRRVLDEVKEVSAP